MSKSRQQKVKNGKRRIERRLRRKNWSQQDEPMFKANNIHYELSERTRGIGVGGIGAVHKLALASGLVEAIDEKVDVLKVHLPYHESDHVLNIAYNILSGGTCLEDIELLRNDEVYLDGLGAQRIPDPTTAGDFCRRLEEKDINGLMEVVYFFYITNKRDIAAEEIVWESNDRCNQENLIAQLKSGVHALETPLDNLESNWAYMVMASLAWNLKAWFGLSLPEKGRWASKYKIEKRAVIEMEFKTFVNAFIRVPAQIIRQGRKTIYRLLAWNPWQPVFLRGFDQFTTRMQC